MNQQRVTTWIALALAAFSLAPLATGASTRVEGQTDFSKIRGVNYFCSYANSPDEMWDHFQERTVDNELSYAAALGFDSVRVWLNYYSYERNPERMLENFGVFLELCRKHGLTAMPILFDSCGVEPADYSGEILPLGEAYQKAIKEADFTEKGRAIMVMQGLPGLATTLGKSRRVPYSKTDPSTLTWAWWTPSPGYSHLDDTEKWSDYENYVRGVLGRFGDHPQVLLWDIMNEPEIVRIFQLDGEWPRISKFVRHFCGVASAIKPRKPITVGAAGLNVTTALADVVDVLSFHSYEKNEEKLQVILRQAHDLSKDRKKPIMITECLLGFDAGPGVTIEEGQTKFYQVHLPIILNSGMGFYSSALMQGAAFGAAGYIFPDGLRKQVADYIEKTLK